MKSIKLQNIASSKPIFILGSINSFGISNLESDLLSIFQSKLPLFQVDIQASEGYLTFSQFQIPAHDMIKSDQIDSSGYTGSREANVKIADDQSQISLEKEQRTLILISKSSKGYILITQMNIDLENRNIRFLTSFEWQNSKIYIRNSYFYRNKAIQDGGSIYLKQIAPLVTLYNTTFDSCSSGNFGGALYVYQVNATNCTFVNNKSKIGGVLFTVFRESKIINSQYINNTASIISPNTFFCPSYIYDRDHISCEIFQIENIFEYNQQLQNTPLYIKEINYTLQTDFNSQNTPSLQAKLIYGIVYIIKLRLNGINFTQYSAQLPFGNVYSYLTPTYQQYFSPFSVPEVNYPYLVVTYVPNLDCQNSNQLIRFDFFQSSFYTPGCFEVSSQCNTGMQQITSINQEQIFQQCQYCNLGQFLYKYNYTCFTCNPNYYSNCYSNLTFLANGFWRNELVEDENSIYKCNLSPSNCESENRIGVGNSLCKQGYKGDQCLVCDLDSKVWGEQYGGTGQFQCIKCNSIPRNTIYFIASLCFQLIIFLFALMSNFKRMKSQILRKYLQKLQIAYIGTSFIRQSQATVYIKILLFNFQIYLSAYYFIDFNKQNESFDSQLFSFLNPFQGQGNSSYDCFLKDIFPESDNIGILKLQFSSLSPLVMSLGMFLIFALLIFRQKEKLSSLIYLIVHCYCYLVLFVFQPSILLYSLQSLKCIELTKQTSYVYLDLSNECDSQAASRIKLLGLISILFYVIINPITMFLFLYFQRKKLENLRVIRMLGFLFDEYKRKFYYWQFLKVLLSNALIILLQILFNQSVLAIIIYLGFLSVYAVLVIVLMPFQSIHLNKVELTSITISILYLLSSISIQQSHTHLGNYGNQQTSQNISNTFYYSTLAITLIFYTYMIALIIQSYFYLSILKLQKFRIFASLNQKFPNLFSKMYSKQLRDNLNLFRKTVKKAIMFQNIQFQGKDQEDQLITNIDNRSISTFLNLK
ncbi:hypothetical protein ABPG72_012392 [Tetrahymena utriculariae]